MANKQLKTIFLSASVPLPERDEKYLQTADVVAIRDAVRALASVVVPKCKLIWGGHPAITPLIRYVMGRMNSQLNKHVTVYQSNYFRHVFPEDNFAFENIEIVQENIDLDSSLFDMRAKMIYGHEYSAGIFIGGMEGVEREFEMFYEVHSRRAKILPIASTGAAAKFIYERMGEGQNPRLTNDYAYMALFQDLLRDIIH